MGKKDILKVLSKSDEKRRSYTVYTPLSHTYIHTYTHTYTNVPNVTSPFFYIFQILQLIVSPTTVEIWSTLSFQRSQWHHLITPGPKILVVNSCPWQWPPTSCSLPTLIGLKSSTLMRNLLKTASSGTSLTTTTISMQSEYFLCMPNSDSLYYINHFLYRF